MSRLSVEECQKLYITSLKNSLTSGIILDINGVPVSLVTTKCHYGGVRFWFSCPGCHKRVGALYRKPLAQYFLCRHCLGLVYQLTIKRRSKDEGWIKLLHSFRNLPVYHKTSA